MNLGMRHKMIFLFTGIAFLLSAVTGVIVYKNFNTSKLYREIANDKLLKVELLGKAMADFRSIRIEVRSLGLVGNTPADKDKFSASTVEAVGEFLKTKEKLTKLEFEPKSSELMKDLEVHWTDFYSLGGELLGLAKKGDPESFFLLSEKVRVICPVRAKLVTDTLQNLISAQSELSRGLVSEAESSFRMTLTFAIVSILVGLCLSVGIGFIFSGKITNLLNENIRILNLGADELEERSKQIFEVSKKISNSAIRQATSLQQTVASIDEISAMVSRNADSARQSAKTSDQTKVGAEKGKEKVDLMLTSITDIASGNDEVMKQIESSNKEISEIVKVIEEISQKTKVINDIVFQTKLLSFNASIEAARAGEHGKGFSVVAEEVGNLASMSGKAADEITHMLSQSIDKVMKIVDGTKSLTDSLVNQSRKKVSTGTATARECADALDEIRENISQMNNLVKEISTASDEQSIGIREINKAIEELDLVSQNNTSVAMEASTNSEIIKDNAEKMKGIIRSLNEFIQGKAQHEQGKPRIKDSMNTSAETDDLKKAS